MNPRAKVSRSKLSGAILPVRAASGEDLDEAQQLATGKNAFEVSVRHHRQFLNVLTTHQFESLDRWHIGRHRKQFIQGPHDTLDAGLRPFVTRDGAGFVGSNYAHGAAVLGYQETTARA